MTAEDARRRQQARRAEPDDERDDLYGQDSFPASDPPSTWWGESEEVAQPAAEMPPAPPPSADDRSRDDRSRDDS